MRLAPDEREEIAMACRCAADEIACGAEGWLTDACLELDLPEHRHAQALRVRARLEARCPRPARSQDEEHTRLLEAALLLELGELP